jgi:PAS domain S-box-containing protein
LEAWVNALVRVRGVATATYSEQAEQKGVELLVPGLAQVLVDRKPAQDPFSAPSKSLEEIRRFNPRNDPNDRVRTSGTITYLDQDGPFCFVQDGESSLYVQLWKTNECRCGDRVELVGFQDGSGVIPYLDQALIRRMPAAGIPVPLEIDADRATARDCDTRLLRLRGQVLRSRTSGAGLELTLNERGTLYTAFLTGSTQPPPPPLAEGSLVQLTGVWSIARDVGGKQRHCRLFLRSAGDVKVLKVPRWWTWRHSALAAALLVLVALAFGGWIQVLRRRTREQALIQDRLRCELALERRFADLVQHAHDIIYTHDIEGRLTSLNPAGERVTGYACGDAIGQNLRDWLAPGSRAVFDSALESARAGGLPRSLALALTAQDGMAVDLEVSLSVVSEGGRPVGLQGIARDVTERGRHQRELEVLNQDLVRASRLAGMAEVATDVLHNVGNVLNSVNVSAWLVIDRLRQSELENLSRLSAMFREHAADLGTFLGQDPRGRQVPAYLESLSKHLAQEKAFILNELETLRKHIDHINGIVAMQQGYARVAGVVEAVRPAQLMEDALRVNADTLARDGVAVRREFAEIPTVELDKHKVLQILVNLIQNARHALAEAKQDRPQLVVRVGPSGPDTLRFEVQDNGVGIARENLARIFSHGFTTRTDGHGFGLHGGSLAAKEMGGFLSGHSEGPGRGAVFALELPAVSRGNSGQQPGPPRAPDAPTHASPATG